MKKLLFIISAVLLCATGVQASEITGKISTDPNAFQEGDNQDDGGGNDANEDSDGEPQSEDKQPADQAPAGGGSILFLDQSRKEQEDKNKTEDVVVLGISHYPDGSLIRGTDHKIYLIIGQIKKQLINLAELKRYAGQEIYEVGDEDLDLYQTRKHLDGELIREKGRDKIYVIENGRRWHILSLEELRARYFGLEIFNIRREEMDLYSA